jgi:deoxyadenosine/deoxycytidine kinase
MKVIFVNGNIGAGKETVMNFLQEVLTNKGHKVKLILEPVQLWRDTGMLDRLYKGEYLAFQKFAIRSRVDAINEQYKEALQEDCEFVFIETHPLIDLYVFAKTTLTKKQFCEYEESWLNEVARLMVDWSSCINLFIYVEPEHCLKRIMTRARNEESEIKLDYLQELHDRHLELHQGYLATHVIGNHSYIYENKELTKFIHDIRFRNYVCL